MPPLDAGAYCMQSKTSSHRWSGPSKYVRDGAAADAAWLAQVGGLAADRGVRRSLSASGRWESGEGWIAGYSALMQAPGASPVQEVRLP